MPCSRSRCRCPCHGCSTARRWRGRSRRHRPPGAGAVRQPRAVRAGRGRGRGRRGLRRRAQAGGMAGTRAVARRRNFDGLAALARALPARAAGRSAGDRIARRAAPRRTVARHPCLGLVPDRGRRDRVAGDARGNRARWRKRSPRAASTKTGSTRCKPGWRTPMRAAGARAGRTRGVGSRPLPALRATPPAKGEGKIIALNPEQQAAADAIRGADGFTAFLLDGVTGSGKTEVYLDAISACLCPRQAGAGAGAGNRPDPQLLARFRARLGVPVHALHSGLNDSERAQAWTAAWRGEARVVVGTRSAVFTPLPDAGLVVVDEEHDASYKQQDGIRYHARDFALLRARTRRADRARQRHALAGIAAQRALRALRAPAPAQARGRSGRRACACSTCASARCRPGCRRNCWPRCAPRSTPAARCCCSATVAATRPRCSATTAAGARVARAAARPNKAGR